ncbi:MAG: hypothetical protein AAF611_18875 [Bacteroidota bacterium]
MNLFKKVMMLLVIGICLSCESDDDATSNALQNIIGNWEVISLVSEEGEEFIEPNEPCFDKYFITEEDARYLEFFPFNDECLSAEDDFFTYPRLSYTYDGTTFIFDDGLFQIIEITENTIKWFHTYEIQDETITDMETLRRIQ